ncbi:uncharacterized protein C2orf73 homolog [Lineus longissimus]|uniref:uncharacterized protein C2orf73 homolog n=1 Tax=Lineus longissimus TaxID=88925 RepID=UPI002B4E4070
MSTINFSRISRKKEVSGKYAPSTFRVMSNDAEVMNAKYQESFPSVNERLPDMPVERNPYPTDFRFNNPHPYNCKFLRHNVRFINEPVCTVFTSDVRSEQPHWWPSRTSNTPLKKPPFTRDTTVRRDFTYDTLTVQSQLKGGNSRHQANPNKSSSLGIVPVNDLGERDGKVRVHKENISYEHQYNSRLDPNYPIRAKRHGSFVWDKLAHEKAAAYLKSINHPVNLDSPDRPSKPSPPSTFRVEAPATTTTTQIPSSPLPGLPVGPIPCKCVRSAPAVFFK